MVIFIFNLLSNKSEPA